MIEQRAIRIETNEQIHVRTLGGISPGNGTEDAHIMGAVLRRQASDLFPSGFKVVSCQHSDQFTQAAGHRPAHFVKFNHMPLTLRWLGESDFPAIARVRGLCYGSAQRELATFLDLRDPRAEEGDFLLAELEGTPVATATSLSLNMWVGGHRVPCQGVAWVGTIKTHRRSSGGGGGLASQVMAATLQRARERGQVVSALMPFRASFYQHFGYGIVERQQVWTVPLSVLPTSNRAGARFYEPSDLPDLRRCRQRMVERGACDIERSDGGWRLYLKKWEEGFVVVDRSSADRIAGYIAFQQIQRNKKDYLVVTEMGYDDHAAFGRLLGFLATLRDQFFAAALTLPAGLPLHRLLREPQLPHRLVNHPHARLKTATRMQLRVLDHVKLLAGLRVGGGVRGRVVVAVRETEGHASRFAVDVEGGQAHAAPSEGSADVECADHVWASMVTGDLPAKAAAEWGLATFRSAQAIDVLQTFSGGPAPFCQEYF